MKKFDKKRVSRASTDMSKRRGSLYDRVAKKIDNARIYIK
jgi:hypothetical protein